MSHIISYHIINLIINLLVLNSIKLFNLYYIIDFYALCLKEDI